MTRSFASAGDLSSLVTRFSSLPGMGSLSRLSQRDKLAEGMVTLRSPQFLMDFVAERNLLPVLFAEQWDAEAKQWLSDDQAQRPSLQDAYVLFREELLSVTEDKNSPGIVLVAVEWGDRQQAAAWVNELISRLNNKMRADAIAEADKTIEFLTKELENARTVELRQSIYFMIETQVNMRTVANVRDEFAFKVISPAVVPDADRYVRPNRTFIVFMGGLTGVALGVLCCFVLFAAARIREELDAGRGSAAAQ